jgi:hypothetical protein
MKRREFIGLLAGAATAREQDPLVLAVDHFGKDAL